MVDYCKIVGVEGEKCDKLRKFIKNNPCPTHLLDDNAPVLWKGRDLAQEWKDLYKRLTGR